MAERLDLPGGWVEFRDPELVPEKLRRPLVNKSVRAARIAMALDDSEVPDLTEDDMDFLQSYQDVLAMCFVIGWSFDPPVSLDGLGELPGRVRDKIVAHVQPWVPRLMPSFSVDGADDPKAPSGS